jgi:hypothetical protein
MLYTRARTGASRNGWEGNGGYLNVGLIPMPSPSGTSFSRKRAEQNKKNEKVLHDSREASAQDRSFPLSGASFLSSGPLQGVECLDWET